MLLDCGKIVELFFEFVFILFSSSVLALEFLVSCFALEKSKEFLKKSDSKALEKSIVEKIVREPGLGLLNPSEMEEER